MMGRAIVIIGKVVKKEGKDKKGEGVSVDNFRSPECLFSEKKSIKHRKLRCAHSTCIWIALEDRDLFLSFLFVAVLMVIRKYVVPWIFFAEKALLMSKRISFGLFIE